MIDDDKKVLTLDQFGEDRFLTLLEDLKASNHPADSRNANWFEHLPNQYKDMFMDWFFLMDGDNFVAFSSIQEFNPMMFRCMARTYVNRRYRSFFSVRDPKAVTIQTYLLPFQLEYLGAWKTIFITRQDPKRRRSFERSRKRAEYWTGLEWIYHPKLLKMFDQEDNYEAWQNVIYNGDEPDLKQITIERYYELFPDQK